VEDEPGDWVDTDEEGTEVVQEDSSADVMLFMKLTETSFLEASSFVESAKQRGLTLDATVNQYYDKERKNVRVAPAALPEAARTRDVRVAPAASPATAVPAAQAAEVVGGAQVGVRTVVLAEPTVAVAAAEAETVASADGAPLPGSRFPRRSEFKRAEMIPRQQTQRARGALRRASRPGALVVGALAVAVRGPNDGDEESAVSAAPAASAAKGRVVRARGADELVAPPAPKDIAKSPSVQNLDQGSVGRLRKVWERRAVTRQMNNRRYQ